MTSDAVTDQRKMVFPGTFDPFTSGHLDVVQRALPLCDELYVAVFDRKGKHPRLDREERAALIRQAVAPFPQVKVVAADGLLVDFCRHFGIRTIVRGVRGTVQYEEEQAMADVNRELGGGIDTVLLPALPGRRSLSSSLVRELLRLGVETGDLVPPAILEEVVSLYGQEESGREALGAPAGGERHE